MKTKLKKSFAAFLALVMCLGMLPTSVFAAPGAADGQIEVPGGSKYYNAGGVEVSASALGENNAVVGLSKNIAATELENVFDITLTVETTLEQEKNFTITEAPDAAVLLTFDLSGTMGREDISSTQTRIEAARSAAQNFINQYKNSAGNTDAKRMLAIVGFDTDAYVIMDWIDVNPKNNSSATASIDNAFRTYSKCTGPGTHSGDRVDAKPCTCASGWTGNTLYWGRHSCTNFDGGMILSRNMLKADAVKNVAKGNTWNFILSDGAPTVTSDDTTSVGTITSESFWASPSGGHGNVTIKEEIQNSKGYLEEIAEEANVFMIGVGVTDNKPFGDNWGVSPAVTSNTTTGQWLNSLATAVGGHYEDVTDTTGMNNAFNRLFNQIKATADEETIESSAWNTVDPIGGTSTPYVEFMGFFGGSNGNTYKGKDNISITKAADGDKADWANNKINWDLKDSVYTKVGDVYTYSIKYRVRLANEGAEFAENTALITNGTTTFSYQTVTNNEFGPVKTVNFPIPQVEGYLADVSFTKVDEKDQPLAGANFTLTHKADCACSDVAIDVMRAESGDNGVVSFANVPSGHTYTLTETSAPSGYYKTGSTWNVTVAYDAVTINGSVDPLRITNLPKGALKVTKDVTGARTEADFNTGAFTITVTGDNYTDSVTLPTAGGSWEYTFRNLMPGSYTVTETTAGIPGEGNGYRWESETSVTTDTVTVASGKTASVTIVNDYSYSPNNVTVSATKIWDDDNNRDGIRPDYVKFALYAGSSKVEEKLVSVGDETDPNKFTVSFTYDTHKYPGETRVEEVGYMDDGSYKPGAVPGYSVAADNDPMSITNTHTPELIDIAVRKIWDDSVSESRIKPVTVNLMDGETELAEIVLDESNNWAYVFTGLDKCREGAVGEEIVYTITEDSLGSKSNWSATIEDAAKSEFFLTFEAPVYTMADLEAMDGWNEKSEEDKQTLIDSLLGQPIDAEGHNAGLETNYGYAERFVLVTNSYRSSSSTVSRTVVKEWKDDNNALGLRPASIEVNLLRNDKVYDTVTLSEENDWSYQWTRLSGRYTWTVEENEVPAGYDASVRKSGSTYTITNSIDEDLIPKTVSRTVIKVWDDDNNSDRPASVSVQLYNGETAYGEAVILNAENGWTYTWNGLDDDGNWTVAEVEVPDGYSSAVTVAGTTFTVTNTYDETEYEEILDEDVPLGDIPETGDASAIWMAMSALSGAGLFLTRKKREDEE